MLFLLMMVSLSSCDKGSVGIMGGHDLDAPPESKLYVRDVEPIIFEASEDNSELVFDLQKGYSFLRTKGSIVEDGEFGGNILDCGNEAFFCIEGSFSGSYPRHAGVTKWSMIDLKCEKTAVVRQSTYVECKSISEPKLRGFVVSPDRQVEQFFTRVGGKRKVYEAVGGEGLPID